jgi:hypothetical protein
VDYCHELKQGEEKEFNIHNPCDKKTVQTCDPLYFTVWGKDKSQEIQCLGKLKILIKIHCSNHLFDCILFLRLDAKCSSLDQIKFTVTYNGVNCDTSVSESTTQSTTPENSSHNSENSLVNNMNVKIFVFISLISNAL